MPVITEYEALLHDPAYFIVEAALVNLCRTMANDKTAIRHYLSLTSGETGWRGRNIRIAWLGISAYYFPENNEFQKELVDYASPSFDFETRLNALNELKKLNYLDETAANHLIAASKYWNHKLAGPAKDIQAYFMQQEKYRELFESMK